MAKWGTEQGETSLYPLPYPLDKEPFIVTEEGGFFKDNSFTMEMKFLALEHKLYIALVVYNGVRRYWAVYTTKNEELFKTLRREDVSKFLKMYKTESEKIRKINHEGARALSKKENKDDKQNKFS